MYDHVIEKGMSAQPERTQFVNVLRETVTAFSTVFIVIDALDECQEEERLKILNDLQKLLTSNCRLLLTGRTDVFERRRFRDNEQLQRWLKEAVYQPIRASQEDVEIFCEDQLRTLAQGTQFTNLKIQIIENISTQADGQYLLL